MELKKLMEHISIIPDYRQAWKVEHKLSDILLLTICAVISGAEGWEDIEDFGETHPDFLKQYGDFENGIPVHDTIARVVSCISPAKFHECFINWMRDCHSSDDKPELAKAWIFANLLAAFLIDDIIQPSLDFPPRSAGSEKKN